MGSTFWGGVLGYNLKLVRERRKGVDSISEIKTDGDLDHNIELTKMDQGPWLAETDKLKEKRQKKVSRFFELN